MQEQQQQQGNGAEGGRGRPRRSRGRGRGGGGGGDSGDHDDDDAALGGMAQQGVSKGGKGGKGSKGGKGGMLPQAPQAPPRPQPLAHPSSLPAAPVPGGNVNGRTLPVAPVPIANPNSRIPPVAPVPVVNTNSRTSTTTRAHITETTFESLALSPLTKQAIRSVLGYTHLTQVQSQTLPVILQGFDVIAKAKTGTGKTMGFLLPTIERLALAPVGSKQIFALAISPTRELASQIRDECEQLITYHKPNLSSGVVFGGTNIKADVRMLSNPPSLLVATPGRLNDLLYNYDLAARCSLLRVLIFDEADQLLEMGFRPDITKILAALEKTKAERQTLLFSATLMQDILQVVLGVASLCTSIAFR